MKSDGLRRTLALLRRNKEVAILVAMVAGATALTGGIFLEPGNLTDVLRAISPQAIMAVAMTFAILTAGIDLSVGSTLALAAVVTGLFVTQWSGALLGPEVSPVMAVAVAVGLALLVGGLAGALQGGLIAVFDIQPFIVTLAGMIGFRGLAKWLSDNNRVPLGREEGSAGQILGEVFATKAVMIGSLVVVAVLAWLLLRFTVFGRNVRAVGDNERAARYAGLPVGLTKMWVYVLTGMMAGLAGLLMAARNRTGDPNFGLAYELDAIAMVVIGGTSLMGGRGSIGGTVFGALVLGIVINVLGLRNVDSNVQAMLMSVIILTAVALQQGRRGRYKSV